MRAMKKNVNLVIASRRGLNGITVAGIAVMLLGGGGMALASSPALPVLGAVSAQTGQRIVVQCLDSAGSSLSGFFSGTIQAIGVSNPASK